jgi:ribosomal-protein-alanine N-acetyltransferase
MSHSLQTERLTLRAPAEEDLPALVPLLNDFDVTKNLTRVPFPYTTEAAHGWLAHVGAMHAKGDHFAFSILCDATFIGVCSVGRQHGRFNLGYWLGRPHWGRGYATEAAARVVRFAFEALGETALASGYYCDNPASGRVLEKLGFEPAGSELMHCVSRNATVVCNRVWLAREDYVQKIAA